MIEAELWAIWDGLRLLWEHGYRKVIVGTDSLNTLNKIAGSPRIRFDSALVLQK